MTGAYVGIGGWTYEPWRGSFYPKGLRQKDELHHASRAVNAIEINGTYYRLQTPASFARWRDETPEGFRFTVKASRYCTNRKDLAEAGEAIERFCGQGLTELGDRLGPILWQFMATKRFEAAEFEAFLKLLPAARDGVALRHALEVRHESFRCAAFVELARRYGAAVVIADHDEYPRIDDVTGGFVYARLMRASADEPAGYADAALDGWAAAVREWTAGGAPEAAGYATARDAAPVQPREAYVFMINGAKERAPAAAQALMQRLNGAG